MAWLHPQLRRHLPALREVARALEQSKHGRIDYTEEQLDAVVWLAEHRVPCTNAYGVPFLAPEYCDKLLVEAAQLAEYKVNEDEEQPYQIPELVVHEHCQTLATGLQVLFDDVFTPVCIVLYGFCPQVLRSVQFAKYTPDNTARGNWHVDADSDITVVASLAPELFEGGGTALKTGAIGTAVVDKLPKGHALLFHGKTTLHKGLPVTSGVRDLLVFWSETK